VIVSKNKDAAVKFDSQILGKTDIDYLAD